MILDHPNTFRLDVLLDGKEWTVMYENCPIYYWPDGEVINVADYHRIPKFVFEMGEKAHQLSRR